MKMILISILALTLTGCRFASYQSPDGTRVTVGSFLTEPKIGGFKSHVTPTTRSTELEGYESKSNAEQVLELLKAVK